MAMIGVLVNYLEVGMFPYEQMEVVEQNDREGCTYFMVQTKSSRDGWEVADIRPDIPNQRRVADLFASAPDLLEALEYAMPYLEACVPNPRNGQNADGRIDVNCVDRARAAISRAKGEK